MASLNVGDSDDDDGRQSSTSNTICQFGIIFEAQNPLGNPVILNHLFQLCPPDILATSRLVCRQWRDISLSSWRKSSPLSFHWNEQTMRMSMGKADTPLNVFWEYYYNPENKCREFPFRSVKFEDFMFDSIDEEIKVFWRVFGNVLTTLKLADCIFPEVDEFRRIIFNYFPNLQALSLRDCLFPNSSPSTEELVVTPSSSYIEPGEGQQPNLRSLEVYEDKKLPISMLELLSHFQSLTAITYRAFFPYNSYYLGNIKYLLNAIEIIRGRDKTKLQLKRFNIINPLIISCEQITHQKFRQIGKLNLPLETLHIRSDQAEGCVNRILERHSKTLRNITVDSESRAGASYWNFPDGVQLEKLESLQMLGGVLCDNLEFLLLMPNLKKLVLRSNRGRQEALAYPEMIKVSNTDQLQILNLRLHNLVEFETDYGMSVEDLQCLINITPNIKILFMPLNDELFGIVCQGWRKLRKIGVYGDSLSDKGVTGYASVQGDPHQHQVANSHGAENEEPPNITLLGDLEWFYGYLPRLTDVSIFNGFLRLPKLRYMHLDIRTGQFGADARAALRNRQRVDGSFFRLNGPTTLGV